MSRRARVTSLVAVSLLLPLAACDDPGSDPTSSPTSTSGGSSATSSAAADAPYAPTRTTRLPDGPVFNQPLPDDVTTDEIQDLVDEHRIPVGPTHGGVFETMTNAMTLQPRHDVMLFGDSMTQQGIDPKVLGDRLSEQAGREVTVFNAASSRARWGINRMVARYAESVDRLPRVAVLVVSTRAAERDNFYTGTVQHTPFSHAVEGCDRPSSKSWDQRAEDECDKDVSDLRYRYRFGGGQVEWARDGQPMQQKITISSTSRLLSNGMIEHPSVTRAESEKISKERGERGFPGFSTVHDDAVEHYRDLVDLLESKGVTVVSTEIPYTPAHQATLESMGRDYDAKRQEAAAELAERGGTEHFPVQRFGDWWGDHSSRDAIHLAPEGAEDFADQLVDDTPGFADAVTAGLE